MVTYSSSSSVSAPNNFSAIYFVVSDIGANVPVGGFDVHNGQVTQSFFNSDSLDNWGLTPGDTANSAAGSNSQNAYDGFWQVFYDANGDGNYGALEDGEIMNRSEQLDISQYDISDFTAYGTTPGTFTFSANVPEPSTGVLTALGLSALALTNGTNVVHFRIAVTNLASFRLECRDSLTNAAWTSLGIFSATGAVTVVTDTNTVPTRFYRAVSP